MFKDYPHALKRQQRRAGKMRIALSSGHALKVRGACGPEPWGLDEVDEARELVEDVADKLRAAGVEVETYHDDFSETQDENLNRIVNWHNGQSRDLDVSFHMNASAVCEEPRGTEVWYESAAGREAAVIISAAIAAASGLQDRGPKEAGVDGSNLSFLSNTTETAVLIETCFVDSKGDCEIYDKQYRKIVAAIAEAIVTAVDGATADEDEDEDEGVGVLFSTHGKCSTFGGPLDEGVAPDEPLAFLYEVADAPHLFLPYQPENTTGLARRLNPNVPYIACRWDDYAVVSKEMLASGKRALVRAPSTGRQMRAWPADTGPHPDTGRNVDLSPGLAEALGVTTDDEVEVLYPAPEGC